MNVSPNPRPILSLPHDPTAWFATGLVALFLVTLGLNIVTGNGLAFLMFIAMLAMVSAMGLSIVAIVRHGERSILVMLPLLVSALVVLFFAIELLVGHD